MSRPHSRWHLVPLLVLSAALILVLAACASGGALMSAGAQAAASGAPAAAEDKAAFAGGTGGGPSAQPAQLAQDARQIVKTGEVTLEVDNVANALGRVRAMAVELGGYVGGAQAGTLDQSATLTLRIPAPRFDDALSPYLSHPQRILSLPIASYGRGGKHRNIDRWIRVKFPQRGVGAKPLTLLTVDV